MKRLLFILIILFFPFFVDATLTHEQKIEILEYRIQKLESYNKLYEEFIDLNKNSYNYYILSLLDRVEKRKKYVDAYIEKYESMLARYQSNEYQPNKMLAGQHKGVYLKINRIDRNWIDPRNWYPLDGFNFVLIDLTLTNHSKDEINFGRIYFTMKDNNGVIRDSSRKGSIDTLEYGKLALSGVVSGKLIFEIDKSCLDNLTLYYEFRYGDDNVINIDI